MTPSSRVPPRHMLTFREKNVIVSVVSIYERTEGAFEIAQRVVGMLTTFVNDPGDLADDEIAPPAFGATVKASDYCQHIERHCTAIYLWPRGHSEHAYRLCWLYYDPTAGFVCFLWDD